MKKRDRPCPFCGSTDLLPFEKGKKGRRDDSLQTVIFAALFVFAAALLLLLITLVLVACVFKSSGWVHYSEE